MVTIRIRCLNCNKFESIQVNERDYLKWMISGDVNDLNLIPTDKILMKKKICNQCRIKEG